MFSSTSLRALEAITHIPHSRSGSLHLVCLLEVGRSDSSVGAGASSAYAIYAVHFYLIPAAFFVIFDVLWILDVL